MDSEPGMSYKKASHDVLHFASVQIRFTFQVSINGLNKFFQICKNTCRASLFGDPDEISNTQFSAFKIDLKIKIDLK